MSEEREVAVYLTVRGTLILMSEWKTKLPAYLS
jgi:hypothetical protein